LAGIVNVTLPLTSDGVGVGEVYPPPDKLTVPVGVKPDTPATVTVTPRLASEFKVDDAGVTVMVAFCLVTVTVVEPVALL